MHIHARTNPDNPLQVRIYDHVTPVADLLPESFTDMLTPSDRDRWNNRERTFDIPMQRIKEVAETWYYHFSR